MMYVYPESPDGFYYCVENFGPYYYIAFVVDYGDFIFPGEGHLKREIVSYIKKMKSAPYVNRNTENAWLVLKRDAVVIYPPNEEYRTGEEDVYTIQDIDGCVVLRRIHSQEE